MKLKYLGDRENFVLIDGAVFKKKGDVLDVDIDIERINPWVLHGSDPIFEVITEVDGAEVIVAKKSVKKRRGFNK